MLVQFYKPGSNEVVLELNGSVGELKAQLCGQLNIPLDVAPAVKLKPLIEKASAHMGCEARKLYVDPRRHK